MSIYRRGATELARSLRRATCASTAPLVSTSSRAPRRAMATDASKGGGGGGGDAGASSSASSSTMDAKDEPKKKKTKLAYGWSSRVHTCRFAEHDMMIMHPDTARGIEVLLNPIYNKGTGYSIAEKERLGIRGLTPPRQFTIDEQCAKIWNTMTTTGKTPMHMWRSMQALQDRNETLFYRLIVEHIEELAPIIYTPTVGEACKHYSRLFRRPRGMYFSVDDVGEFNAMMYNWKNDVSVIVVTDGSRVLGLGDLGAQGMGISVGKLDLYVAGAGIDPEKVLPCVLDVGTDNEELLNSPYYFGIQQPRLRGKEYDDFVDEFVQAVKNRWPNALVQFEDFSTKNAMPILKRHRDNVLCFNDDIQGTAVTVLAGVYGAMASIGSKPSAIVDQTFVICGAGSAGMGIANFLHSAMVHHGLSKEDAYKRFYVVDHKGLITSARVLEASAPGVEDLRAFAASRDDLPEGMTLEDVVAAAKPTVLMGASTARGIFTETILRTMGECHERPIIMPLSNPTSCAECTAEEAAKATGGRAIFSAGSPFDDVVVDGRTMVANQGNNFYVFPGLGLGTILVGADHISDGMLNAAAEAIPKILTREQLNRGEIYPAIKRIRDISVKVAAAVMRQAIFEGREGRDGKIAQIFHQEGLPALEQYARSSMYYPEYRPTVFSPGSGAGS
jgi:malate dehydrogenase (decarboxylating)